MATFCIYFGVFCAGGIFGLFIGGLCSMGSQEPQDPHEGD